MSERYNVRTLKTEPKTHINDRLTFTLDFQNDYDIIG